MRGVQKLALAAVIVAGLSLASASSASASVSVSAPSLHKDHTSPGRPGLGLLSDNVVAAPPAALGPARVAAGIAAEVAGGLATLGALGDGCVNTSTPLNSLGCGPINCFLCMMPSTNTGNVSCHSPTEPTLWSFYRAEHTANPNLILLTGLAMAFNKNDVTANTSSCGCTVNTIAVGALNESCSVRVGVCTALVPNGTASGDEALVRAKAWVQKPGGGGDSSAVGLSAGWPNASAGYPPSASGQAKVSAVHDLQTHLSTRCFPAELPPLVIVPGLTSSALEYKLTNAKPANGEFWCDRSTGGEWRSMWPLNNSLLAKPAKFACWASEMQVQFLPGANAFAPARQGEETRLVDFGSFGGIPGLGEIADEFEQVGWQTGKNLFGAPFDWRLPSTAQDQFFASLKQLVESASASNGGKKVALWAFSFGPQYTLSFLHRMEQSWKDQYIAAFVATSPVWAGAPAAIISFATGYDVSGGGGGGGPIPNLPKQCARFTTDESVCYTGASKVNQTTGTLADCCGRASASISHLFNWFDKNDTCQLVNSYTGSYPCADGALGYIQTRQRQRRGGGGARVASAATPSLAGLDPGAILIKTLARASPSLMWAFPHAGTNASHEWTADDVLLQTPVKNYTAFDYPELLRDLGVSAATMAQQTFLSAEPDLKLLAAPGVPTFVTYGHNLSTVATAVYNVSFTGKPKQLTRPPAKLLNEDGDGLVPRRSCTRSEIWAEAQAAGGHPLWHRGYVNQPHAACFPSQTPGSSQQCFEDVLSLLITGGLPPSE